MVRCIKQIRKNLKGFLREADAALESIIDENCRAVFAECRTGQTTNIPAIAHDMKRHERDNRVFGTMQASCKIETGADYFCSDRSCGLNQKAFVRKLSGGSESGSSPMIISPRLIL